MNKRQYLELMGIDVWQRRPEKPVLVAENDVPAQGEAGIEQIKQLTAVEAERSPVQSQATPTQNEHKDAPSFLLVFADFPGICMVSMYSIDLAAMPANHQRFLSTLFYGLSGNKVTTTLEDFRWPMLKSSHVSQTEQEAKQILTQHVKRRPELLLAFGHSANYLGIKQSADYSRVLHNDKDIFALPDLDHFFDQPLARRELWQKLESIRPMLRSPTSELLQ